MEKIHRRHPDVPRTRHLMRDVDDVLVGSRCHRTVAIRFGSSEVLTASPQPLCCRTRTTPLPVRPSAACSNQLRPVILRIAARINLFLQAQQTEVPALVGQTLKPPRHTEAGTGAGRPCRQIP